MNAVLTWGPIVLGGLAVLLAPANMLWHGWTSVLKSAKPGTPLYKKAEVMCRITRYPGFLFFLLVCGACLHWLLFTAPNPWARGLTLVVLLLLLGSMQPSWSVLVHQVRTDADDPFRRWKSRVKT